jgi:F0F1-type ATP synthase membrane subunit b/b'
MSALRRHVRLALFAAFLVWGAGGTPMIAAEDVPGAHHAAAGAEHHDAHHEAALSDLFIPAINFSIYLFIVIRYVIPAMREYLRRRHADIVQAASDSSVALASAEQSLTKSKARFSRLQTESDAIRQDLILIANRQGERLLAQADESGKRRLADAALLAEQERRRALADVRAEIATKATQLAEGRIRTALTADDQRTFVQQFLKDASR